MDPRSKAFSAISLTFLSGWLLSFSRVSLSNSNLRGVSGVSLPHPFAQVQNRSICLPNPTTPATTANNGTINFPIQELNILLNPF